MIESHDLLDRYPLQLNGKKGSKEANGFFLHVEGIVFHVNDRMLEMAGDENGDFKIRWLNPKENETVHTIVMQKPKDDPWKREFVTIR